MSWSKKGRQLKQRLSQVNWYLYFGLVFLLSVMTSIAWAGFKLHGVINDADALPIEAIAVKGDLHYTSNAEIQAALQSLMARSFFNADVQDVQAALEALPWVHRASVRREWPAKFKVTIQEQHVAARWNDVAWVNTDGEVFDALAKPEMATLPVLHGPDEMAAEVLTNYSQLNELLRLNGFELVSLALSPRHAWQAELANGIKLELGREDKMTRIQRFINAYPVLSQSKRAVAKVDLRYDTGFAVDWDDTKQENKK